MVLTLLCACCQAHINEDKMEVHLRQKLRIAPFSCLLCDARFYTRRDAELHFTPLVGAHPKGTRPAFSEHWDPGEETRVHRLRSASLPSSSTPPPSPPPVHSPIAHHPDTDHISKQTGSHLDPEVEPLEPDIKVESRRDWEELEESFFRTINDTIKQKKASNRFCTCRYCASSEPKTSSLHICDTCNRVFGYTSSLKQHRRAHDTSQWFPCSVAGCNATFSWVGSRKRHERTVHGQGEGERRRGRQAVIDCRCPNCKDPALSHLRTRLHVCDHGDCRRTFARGSALLVHLRRHTGDRPFACLECDGKFVTRDSLLRHQRRGHPSPSNVRAHPTSPLNPPLTNS